VAFFREARLRRNGAGVESHSSAPTGDPQEPDKR
jgi:hypothetical protein